MLNHCLNRRSPAHEQCHPFQLGNVRSYLLLQEAHCLWDVVQPKKFSGVKTTHRYAKNTITRHLKNLADRFECSEEKFLQQIKQSNFQHCYYAIVQQNRRLSRALSQSVKQ